MIYGFSFFKLCYYIGIAASTKWGSMVIWWELLNLYYMSGSVHFAILHANGFAYMHIVLSLHWLYESSNVHHYGIKLPLSMIIYCMGCRFLSCWILIWLDRMSGCVLVSLRFLISQALVDSDRVYVLNNEGS